MRFADEGRYLSTGVGVRGSAEARNAHLIMEQRGIMKMLVARPRETERHGKEDRKPEQRGINRRVANEQVPLDKEWLPWTKMRQFARLSF